MSAACADPLDRAQQFEEQQRAAALAQHKARPIGPGAEVCADCGGTIPIARRRALPHADRCVGCQTLYERRLP